MKKTVKVVFAAVITLTALSANAQWIYQVSGTTQILRDVEFMNKYTGWIVGDGGTILKTTNGGNNWVNIPNPAVGKPLSAVKIIDTNIVYVVGWFEKTIKTTNSGYSRTQENTRTGIWFWRDIYGYNDSIVWGEGGGGRIMHTTNGGETLVSNRNHYTSTPKDFKLHQNYLNLFNAMTGIQYQIKSVKQISLLYVTLPKKRL